MQAGGSGAAGVANAPWRGASPSASGAIGSRDVARETVHGVAEHDLLTFGSAIAFQVATAIPPLLMLSLALAGALGFGDVWRDTVAPEFERAVSHDVFVVVNKAATAALSNQAAFWLTFGVALTLWEMSGAVRALMTALSRIYGDDDEPLAHAPLRDLVRALARAGGAAAERAGRPAGRRDAGRRRRDPALADRGRAARLARVARAAPRARPSARPALRHAGHRDLRRGVAGDLGWSSPSTSPTSPPTGRSSRRWPWRSSRCCTSTCRPARS